MTIQEIEEFVQGELSYLNLSTSQQRKYVNFVKKYDNYYQFHNLPNNPQNTLLEKLEECIEFFMMQGFDDKVSLEYAKNILPEFDCKDLKEKISFLRILNLEERIVGNAHTVLDLY